MNSNAFDLFVQEQMQSPTFAETFRHEGAKIAATDRIMNAFPGHPVPRFQTSYYLASTTVDNKGKEKVKLTRFLGQAVGLTANVSCGTVHDAVWSERHNQWYYTLYPWSATDVHPASVQSNKRATEEMILPIRLWLHEKLGLDVVVVCDTLNTNRGEDMAIVSTYRALLSGRASDVPKAILNLRRLVDKYNGG